MSEHDSERAREIAEAFACSCGKVARNIPHHGSCRVERVLRALTAARAEGLEAAAKAAEKHVECKLWAGHRCEVTIARAIRALK